MSVLLAWRNPQGEEYNWLWARQGIPDLGVHVAKVIVTEVGLPILTISSVIETVIYAVLLLLSLAIYPLTDAPFDFFNRLLQSSLFMILWAVVDFIFYNPYFVNVMTQESFARYWAQRFNPTSIALQRLEDRLFIADWGQRHPVNGRAVGPLLGPIANQAEEIQRKIDAGSDFIKQDILPNVSAETLELFKDRDPSIYMFMLTKAVFIYGLGSKRAIAVPDFFKDETRQLIEDLRQEMPNPGVIEQQLQVVFVDLGPFDIGPQDHRPLFTRLRNIATGELQGSLLCTGCLTKALQPVVPVVPV
jgi:hypothetical protein